MAPTQYRFPAEQAGPTALDAFDDPDLLAFLAAAVDLADYAAAEALTRPRLDPEMARRVEAFRTTSIVYGYGQG